MKKLTYLFVAMFATSMIIGCTGKPADKSKALDSTEVDSTLVDSVDSAAVVDSVAVDSVCPD